LDSATDAVIHYLTLTYDPKKNKNIALPVSMLTDANVKSCIIQIKNEKTHEIQNLFYRLNEQEQFVPIVKKQ
jgi:hypothetical protein